MEQQILTKFATIKYLIKQNLIDDVSNIILINYMEILIDIDNWRKICPWIVKIRIHGINSNIKCQVKMTAFDKLNKIYVMSVEPNYDLNLFSDLIIQEKLYNIGTIHMSKIYVSIDNNFHILRYNLHTHMRNGWIIHDNPGSLEIIDYIKALENTVRIEN